MSGILPGKQPFGDSSPIKPSEKQGELQPVSKPHKFSLLKKIGKMAKGQKAKLLEDKKMPLKPQAADSAPSIPISKRQITPISPKSLGENSENLPQTIHDLALTNTPLKTRSISVESDIPIERRSEESENLSESARAPSPYSDILEFAEEPSVNGAESSLRLPPSQEPEHEEGLSSTFNFNRLVGKDIKELEQHLNANQNKREAIQAAITLKEEEIQSAEQGVDEVISSILEDLTHVGVTLDIKKEKAHRDVPAILKKITEKMHDIKTDLEKSFGPSEKRNVSLRKIAFKQHQLLESCLKKLQENKDGIALENGRYEISTLKRQLSLIEEKNTKINFSIFEQLKEAESNLEIFELENQLDEIDLQWKEACQEGYINGDDYVREKDELSEKIEHLQQQLSSCRTRIKLFEEIKNTIPETDYLAHIQSIHDEMSGLESSLSELKSKRHKLQSTYQIQQTLIAKKERLLKDISNKLRAQRNEALIAATLTSEYLTESSPSAPPDDPNRFDKHASTRKLLTGKLHIVLEHPIFAKQSTRLFYASSQYVTQPDNEPQKEIPKESSEPPQSTLPLKQSTQIVEVNPEENISLKKDGLYLVSELAKAGKSGNIIYDQSTIEVQKPESQPISVKEEFMRVGSEVISSGKLAKKIYHAYQNKQAKSDLTAKIKSLEELNHHLIKKQKDLFQQIEKDLTKLEDRRERGDLSEGSFIDFIYSFDIKNIIASGPSKEELENLTHFLENYELSDFDQQDPLVQSVISQIIRITALSEQRFINQQVIKLQSYLLQGDDSKINEVVEIGTFLGTATQLTGTIGKHVALHMTAPSTLFALGMTSAAGVGVTGLFSLISASSELVKTHEKHKFYTMTTKKLDEEIKTLEASIEAIQEQLNVLEDQAKTGTVPGSIAERQKQLLTEEHQRKSLILSAKNEKRKFIKNHRKFMNKISAGSHALSGLGSMATLASFGLGIATHSGVAATAAIGISIAATGWGAIALAGTAIIAGGVVAGYKLKEKHEKKGIEEKSKSLEQAEKEYRDVVKSIARYKTHFNDEIYREFQQRLDNPSKALEKAQGELENEVYKYQLHKLSEDRIKKKITADIKQMTPSGIKSLILELEPQYALAKLKQVPREKDEDYLNRLQSIAIRTVGNYITKELATTKF